MICIFSIEIQNFICYTKNRCFEALTIRFLIGNHNLNNELKSLVCHIILLKRNSSCKRDEHMSYLIGVK